MKPAENERSGHCGARATGARGGDGGRVLFCRTGGVGPAGNPCSEFLAIHAQSFAWVD